MLTKDGRKNTAGLRIRSLRKEHGLSQEQLISALQLEGLDSERGVIKRIENGTRGITDLELVLFAHFFNVSYRYLIEGDPREYFDGSIYSIN